VLSACDRACLALEVVDSVWTDYRFDLEHNTADGSSAAGYVLGGEIPLTAATIVVDLLVDTPDDKQGWTRAAVDGSGTLRAAAEAVAWLADRLFEDGLALRSGDVVLTGGLTRATPVAPGSVVRAQATGSGIDASVSVQGAPQG
jgi:2-keto-4-pentenoate hydratase